MANPQLKERHRPPPRPAPQDAHDILLTLLGGAPSDWTLSQIASAAAGHCGADFVGIGRAAAPLPFLACQGAPGLLLHREQGALAAVMQRALEERGIVAVPADAADRARGLRCVAAVRLEGGSRALGVLAAGFSHSIGRTEEQNLRAFAALAAMTLEQERLRQAAAEAWSAHAAAVEFSSGRLLVIQRDGCVRCASAEVKAVAGLRNEGPRPRLEELFPPARRAAVALWRESLPLDGSAPLPPALEGVLRSGAGVRLNCLSSLATGEWLLSLEDAAERQRSEARRKTAEAELIALLDSLREGVLLFDESGALRLANRSFARLLHWPAAETLEATRLADLAGKLQNRFRDSAVFARRWREAHESQETVTDQIELLHPAPRALERMVRPIFDADGRRGGTLEIYREPAAEPLVHGRMLQTQKLAVLGQLVASVAHELNNPLTTILGYAQRLSEGRETDATPATHRIAQEARRAGNIVRNLLSFAREAGSDSLPTDLNDLVERVAALRAYHCRLHNIVLDLDLHPGLPQPRLDPQKWQQVVLNLLINAQQAIEKGRGRGRITVRTRPLAGQRISLEVEDDGPGVPPHMAARVFDPFFSTKPPGEGTGLGLWIVAGIVQDHGGRIVHEAVPTGGARFLVEIPLPTAEPAATPAAPSAVPVRPGIPAEAPRPAASAAITGKRILVVEDEPTIASLIVDVLSDMGHSVAALTDSDDALDRVLRDDQAFDLLICDLRMPRVDGRAFFQTLARNRSPLRHRILFITGDTLSPRTLEFLQRHALVFLAKPFLVEELQDAVNRCWERAGLTSNSASELTPTEATPS